MPANSLTTPATGTRVIGAASYGFSKEDTYALLFEIPSGGTVLELPTPGAIGESYEFLDVDGSCASGHPVTLEASEGTTIQGASSVEFTSAFAWARAVWSGTAWALENAGAPATPGLVTSFVWRPGVTPPAGAINTFETWAEVAAAKAALPVGTAITVSVDGTHGALSITSASNPVDLSGITFVDFTGQFSPILCEQGVVVTPAGTLYLSECAIANNGTTSPITVGANEDFNIIAEASVIVSNTAAALVALTEPTSSFALLAGRVCIIGDNTHPVVSTVAGTVQADNEVVVTGQSSVLAGALVGAGAASFEFSVDCTVDLDASAGAWVKTCAPLPNQVSGFLGAATAATVAINIGNISPIKTGQYAIQGSISGTCSAACVVTTILLRDGNPFGPTPTLVQSVGAGASFTAIAPPWIDTPADGLAHNYGMQCTASAGTITTVDDGGAVVVVELL